MYLLIEHSNNNLFVLSDQNRAKCTAYNKISVSKRTNKLSAGIYLIVFWQANFSNRLTAVTVFANNNLLSIFKRVQVNYIILSGNRA